MRNIALLLVLISLTLGCNVSDDPQLVDKSDDCDACGVCDDDPSNDCEEDCAGVAGGDAVEDACGVCDADPTNDCVEDCAGVLGGDAVEDNCGTCDADPTNDCAADCAGVDGGDAVEDMCGVCDADATNDCVADCAGEFGGDAVEDMCGVCDADATNDCVQDCNGEFGGMAVTDACGRCVEGTTGLVACPTATLKVIEDAHVSANQASANFGGSTELLVDRSNTETYLKFDLGTLPNDIVIRGLTLKGTAFESTDFGGTGDVGVYFSSTDSWSERTITYDTKPAFSDFILASWNVKNLVADQDTTLEIVDDVELLDSFQAQVFGDKTVTLMLASPGFQSKYYSKESTDAAKHVTLEVAYQVLSKVDVPAVADAFVYTSSPDANYGGESSLRVDPRSSASANPPYTSFVKFDLSTIPSNVSIERVSLQMLAYQGFAYGGNGTCYSYLVDDDTWQEATLTFNNMPTWQPTAVGSWWLWYNNTPADRWGITATEALVQPTIDAYGSDKLISFRLASSGYRTEYRSREWTNAAQHPKLTVYFTAD